MKLWTILWFEIRKLIRARVVLLNLFLLPLLLIFILGNALSAVFDSGEDIKLDKSVVTLVKPAGEAAGDFGLQEFLDSPEIKSSIEARSGVSREQAEADLRSGKIDFAVVIPEGFEANVNMGQPAHWEYILGKDHLKNHVATMTFDAYLDEVNRIQASAIVLGPEKAIPAQAGAENNAAFSYVENASLNEKGDSYSAFQYYAASMLIMFLLYSGLMVNESLNSEIEGKTLYRLGSMPISPLQIFVGKIFGNSIVTLLQAAVIIFGTSWLYGVKWGAHPGYLLAICVLVVLCSMMLAVTVSLLSKSQTTANAIVQFIIILMTFLSGGFQPIPVDLIQKLSEGTVNHWALQGILRIMLDAAPSEILHHILMLSIVGGVLLLIGMISYRKAGYQYE